MHKLLLRQLRRFGGSEEAPPGDWEAFLRAVSDAYHGDAQDRALQERMLDVMSRELEEQHARLRADVERRRRIEEALRESEARLRDEISERTRMETELQLKHRLQAVGQLAAGIAHEINTPVQYVGDTLHFLRDAFVEVRDLLEGYRTATANIAAVRTTPLRALRLQEEAADLEYLDARVDGAFDRVLEGTARVAAIVRAVKDFGRPDSREMQPADINQAIESTLVVSQSEWSCVADVETIFGDLPPVLCHVGDMNQVFLGLIVNAAQAIETQERSGDRRGLIRISTARSADDIVVIIADSGCGIRDDIRNRIFDPFFTTREVGRGIGQGLAIARSIVLEKHRGSLSFESEVGKGSTFEVRIPIHGKPRRADAA